MLTLRCAVLTKALGALGGESVLTLRLPARMLILSFHVGAGGGVGAGGAGDGAGSSTEFGRRPAAGGDVSRV